MTLLRDYALSLTAAALISGMILSFFESGSTRKLLQLICGILLTVTALQPLSRLELPDLSYPFGEHQRMAEAAAAMGQEMAETEKLGFIQEALEAYILDKAAAMGLDISVSLILDSTGNPVSANIEGNLSEPQKKTLQAVITNDLGIPGEDQKWIMKKNSP